MAEIASAAPIGGAPLRNTRATSKMALLLSFAAGAAFSWFITQVVMDEDERAVRTSLAAPAR